jgi:hypothetical protein
VLDTRTAQEITAAAIIAQSHKGGESPAAVPKHEGPCWTRTGKIANAGIPT